ncbi:MAG: hypothetical protein AAFR41_02460 [Pseudomonadota bacterium]
MLKSLLIVTVRAVRGSSAGKAVAVVSLLGAAYGASQIASLISERTNQTTMLASVDEAEPAPDAEPVGPAGPWSEQIGERDYEKVVSVALLPGDEVAFAGLSVGLTPEDGAKALLVRANTAGDILGETVLAGMDDATVSDIELGGNGDAFITAWQEGAIKVTKVDITGRFAWERRFNVTNQAARVVVAPSPDGAAMVLLAEAFQEGELRVMRLDGDGRVVWRRDVNMDLGGSRSLGIAADSIGGGVFAASVEGLDGTPGVELARLDRRGREIWRQTVQTGYEAGLSDLSVDADGVAVLIGGRDATVFKLDPLGQFIWSRDLPDLNATGSKIVSRSDTGEVHVIAEPLERLGESRLWLSSFDADGQPKYTRLRTHDRTLRIEDFAVDGRGGVYAGGAIARRRNGDTDMLMMSTTPEGDFPEGFVEVTLTDADRSVPTQRGPFVSLDTSEPIVSASLGADGEGRIVVTTPTVDALEPVDSVREVSAPDRLPVAAVAVLPASEPLPGDNAPAGTEATGPEAADAAPPAPEPSDIATEDVSATPPAAATPRTPEQTIVSIDRPSGIRAGNFAYNCTYVCQATMVDESLKYPATRRISDVMEGNAELFSLDAMALHAGVCLSSDGKLPDGPRLPPVCERAN